MTIINPNEPGDIIYPQYAVIDPQGLTPGDVFVKGKIYSKAVTGLMESGNPANFDKGMYQSIVTPDTVPVAGDTAQFCTSRTRMAILAQVANLVEGEDVSYNPVTGKVIAGAKTDALYLGKIWKIETRNQDSTLRLLTAVDDLLTVETVGR